MGIQRRSSGVTLQSREKERLSQLEKENEHLTAQVTDLQLALCDLYERLEQRGEQNG